MQKIRIGLNGFGRIGRVFTRIALNNPAIKLVAINDIAPIEAMAHLLRYDSTHGKLANKVEVEKNKLIIDGNPIKIFCEQFPEKINWQNENVDIVIECTGKFKTAKTAKMHINGGAKRVIISAPPDDLDTKTIVLGINDEILFDSDLVVSNASCTTNSAAPLVKVLDENFKIISAYITTVHSFTTDQRLQDSYHKDFRRARGATTSIVPTTTGAAKALTKIFPHLNGAIGGCGIRVPVPDGSLTDLSCIVEKETNINEINSVFKRAAQHELKGILEYTSDPIVSIDIVGNPHSCIFDSGLTSSIGKMVKVVGWYDNEYGYCSRLVDLALNIGRRLK